MDLNLQVYDILTNVAYGTGYFYCFQEWAEPILEWGPHWEFQNIGVGNFLVGSLDKHSIHISR